MVIQKTPFRIGRGKGADLHLPDPSLSKIHLLLRKQSEGGQWSLQDCSQNGVKQGEQFLPQRVIEIEYKKTYQLNKNLSVEFFKEPITSESGPTVIQSQRPTQLMQWNETENHLEIKRALLRYKDPKSGLQERYVLGDGLSLGRHPSNDLVLNDGSVSQFHARLEIRSNQLMLSDLGSTNGTRIDKALTVSSQIQSSCKIQLGELSFDLVIEKERAELTNRTAEHFFGMRSTHPKMKQVFSLIETVAPSEASALIQGESGTGKELVARAIHQLSNRAGEAFVALNCAAIPKDLLESELFGHSKGAFSGAVEARKGAFESADGGTLFLDEIGELGSELQAKLLRALESGEVKRLGSDETKTVNVRIVSATHQNLSQLIKDSKFRSDLYFRLHVVPIRLLPLRERLRDLDVLIPDLIHSAELDATITKEAQIALSRYDFPGNIRELKNILQRASIMARVDQSLDGKTLVLRPEHFLFLDDLSRAKLMPRPEEIKERQAILSALESNNFNQSKAAKDLGVAVSTLHDRIRRFRIDIPKRRKSAA